MMVQAPEYLTVRELAELLRIKERKVYDLAASGQVPVSRATGKLLFPEAEVRAWIDGHLTRPSATVDRPKVMLGSFDPLLEWAIRQSQCGLASLLDGSSDGLERFAAAEGLAAGIHIHDANSDDWNIVAVSDVRDQDAVLLAWAKRMRGLVMRPELQGQVNTVEDLRGRTVAARQRTSGTEVLLSHLLDSAGIAPSSVTFTEPVRSERDAVMAVVESEADVTFGLEALARPFGLPFVPLVEERFDLLVDRRAFFESAMQGLMTFTRTRAFQDKARILGGYDIADLGKVRWNA